MDLRANSRSLPAFTRVPLPKRFCNFERLLYAMEARGLDGIVASSRHNVFYLSGFNPMSNQADETPRALVIISRREPDHPIMVTGDMDLSHFLYQPTWIEDIRPYRGGFTAIDIPWQPSDVDRFIPESDREAGWVKRARSMYASNRDEALKRAMKDLGLDSGRVGFDDFRLAYLVTGPEMEVLDASNLMMFARQVKTSDEVSMLREATQLNQTAMERTARAWGRGMTWKELNHTYHKEVIDLGGFVHDPGGVVIANPTMGLDPVVMMATGFEDFVVEPGINIMFDCHGTLNMYCWDGGKSWVVEDEPRGLGSDIARATGEAMGEIQGAMRPGAKVSELQAKGRQAYQRLGVPGPESVFIFFHGLGLSHNDVEQLENRDWTMENGMVIASHILYPGDERHRYWLEAISLVTSNGGETFFTWGFDPLTNS